MLAFIHHHYPKKLSLEEIAMATGFSSAAYYGKVFREACKMTPKEYRQKENKKRQETKDHECYRISGGK